jgi:hypothetical protein
MQDSDDSFLAGAGRKGSDYSAGGSLFHSRVGRARAVSQAMNMAKELRALGIPCGDDLSPVRPELLHESSSGVGASPELLHGVRRKKKIFDAVSASPLVISCAYFRLAESLDGFKVAPCLLSATRLFDAVIARYLVDSST